MKASKYVFVLILVLTLIVPAASSQVPDIPDTGDLYGDLYVILRDENGVPMLAENGCIQPISSVDASVTIETNEGLLEISVEEGEPFALPTYTDPAGDLVECELTEEMATWVQTVDFGRLNLGRAPESVLAHAFDEAIKKMNVSTVITIDPAGRLVLTVPDEDNNYVAKTIDSPAENLALYIKMMIDGHWITLDTEPIEVGGRPGDKGPPEGDGPSTEPRPVLDCFEEDGVTPTALQINLTNLGYGDLCEPVQDPLTSQELLLAASLLAAAADKTGNITLDKVVYINSIYGINQVGSLYDEATGKTYFDFGAFVYGRTGTFASRASGTCEAGFIWVLQPDLDEQGNAVLNHFEAMCMAILGYDQAPQDNPNAVHFTNMSEGYTTVSLEYDFADNVRGFAQAADDALQVLEYTHNYKVPEELYPAP